MLKVGIIKYLNVYPVYEHLLKCQFCEFVYNEPLKLNEMLRKGKIDISPSSSYEFLKYKSIYELIGNFSISSRKKVMSVILVLNKKIENIDKNDTIYLSPSSASSNNLTKIIFYEFLRKHPKFEIFNVNEFQGKNQLLIGDNALELYFNKENLKFNIYDVAELWYNFTKLPFVFALWIGNKINLSKKEEYLEFLKKILKKAIRSYRIPKKYKNFSENQIQQYFENISYEFTEIHNKSLKLYEKLLKKWNLI